MWNFLYRLASPRSFYQFVRGKLPYLGVIAFFLLTIGLLWGLFFAPPDYQQGDAFRIIYIHVPAAFLSLSIYASMTFCALLLLVWRIKLAGIFLAVLAEVGAWMAFIALVTGSIWGKPMWGTWWVWDARLTSELILLLLYFAIITLNLSFKNKAQADKMMAVLSLVGCIDLPIIHYSVYWWNSLHQGSTLSVFSKPKIAAEMLYPLLMMLFGFVFYTAWLCLKKASSALLEREKKQQWVKQLFQEGCL